jgi:hypothetical protein
MKHILLFENFKDEIDPAARDLFMLVSEFIITYTRPIYGGGGDNQEEYCMIKGPSENYNEVKPLIDEIQEEEKELEENIRTSDGKYIDDGDIDDLFYEKDYYKKLLQFGYYVYHYHGSEKGYIGYNPETGTYMKEEYQDDIGKSARDIFGLIHTEEIYDMFGGTGIVISGPSEESENAHKIVREIQKEIDRKLPHSRAAPRHMWVEIVNDIMKQRKYDLSDIGYRIETWYNGAESPELSR